jgi:hypothetical protein
MRGAGVALFSGVVLAGCGGKTPASPQPVELTVGAMVQGGGRSCCSSDWAATFELAATDVNTALASVNAGRMGTWRKPVTFHIEERDASSVEQTAHDLMDEFNGLGAKIVISEATNASIGANRWNYERVAAGKTDMIPLVSYSAISASLNNGSATDPDPVRQAAIADPADWFFRTCPTNDNLAALRLGYVFHRGAAGNGDVNGDGVVKIVWLGTTDVATQTTLNSEIAAFTAYASDSAHGAAALLTKNVSFDSPVDPSIFDYAGTLSQALDASDGHAPDLIVNKMVASVAIALIEQYDRTPNATVQMFEDATFRRNSLLAALGTAGNGQIGVSNIGYEAGDSGAAFASELAPVTGWPPTAFEAQAYDAVVMALLAVIKASQQVEDPATQITPAAVRDNLKTLSVPSTQDPNRRVVTAGPAALAEAIAAIADEPRVNINYDGASGPVDFDAAGNVSSRGALWSIQGQKFIEPIVYDCVTSSACPQVPRDPGLAPR